MKCSEGTSNSCTAAASGLPVHKHALEICKNITLEVKDRKKINNNKNNKQTKKNNPNLFYHHLERRDNGVLPAGTAQHRQLKTLSPDPDSHAVPRRVSRWREGGEKKKPKKVQHVQSLCTFGVLQSRVMKH